MTGTDARLRVREVRPRPTRDVTRTVHRQRCPTRPTAMKRTPHAKGALKTRRPRSERFCLGTLGGAGGTRTHKSDGSHLRRCRNNGHSHPFPSGCIPLDPAGTGDRAAFAAPPPHASAAAERGGKDYRPHHRQTSVILNFRPAAPHPRTTTFRNERLASSLAWKTLTTQAYESALVPVGGTGGRAPRRASVVPVRRRGHRGRVRGRPSARRRRWSRRSRRRCRGSSSGGITPRLAAAAGFSSMLSLTLLAFSPPSTAIASREGVT